MGFMHGQLTASQQQEKLIGLFGPLDTFRWEDRQETPQDMMLLAKAFLVSYSVALCCALCAAYLTLCAMVYTLDCGWDFFLP